jgi:hypothetical protein
MLNTCAYEFWIRSSSINCFQPFGLVLLFQFPKTCLDTPIVDYGRLRDSTNWRQPLVKPVVRRQSSAVAHVTWALRDIDASAVEAPDSDTETHGVDRPRAPPKDGDWAEFNAANRGDALAFVRRNPQAQLILVTILLQQSLLKLEKGLLERAGKGWAARKVYEACRANASMIKTRMADASSCRLTNVFFANTTTLFTSEASWEVLRPDGFTRSVRSCCFAMLSTAYCGVKQMIHEPNLRYPQALWRILGEDVDVASEFRLLKKTPRCMVDEFTEKIRRDLNITNDEVDVVASDLELLQVLLLHLALFFDLDIVDRENTNAWIRRALTLRTQTWTKKLSDASAALLLHCRSDLLRDQRTALKMPPASDHGPKSTKRKRTCDSDKPAKTCRGGAQRSFMSEFLTGKRMPDLDTRKRLFTEATDRFHDLTPSQIEKHKRLGRHGTIAAKAGGAPFGVGRLIVADEAQAETTDSSHLGSVGATPAPQETNLALVASAEDSASQLAVGTATDQLLASKLADLRVKQQLLSRERAKKLESDTLEIQHWKTSEASNASNIAKTFARISAVSPIEPNPTIGQIGTLNFDHIRMVAPSKDFAELLGSLNTRGWQGKEAATVHRLIEERWELLHRPAEKKYVQKLGDVPTQKHAVCYYAGFCLCKNPFVKRVVANVQAGLRTWLAKGTTARRLYDRAALCLQIWNDSGSVEEYRFYHVGYGNLKTCHFTLMRLHLATGLRRVEAALDGLVACEVKDSGLAGGDGGAANLWQCFSDLDRSQAWRCQLMRLYSDSSLIERFLPTHVELQGLTPLSNIEVSRPRRQRAAEPLMWQLRDCVPRPQVGAREEGCDPAPVLDLDSENADPPPEDQYSDFEAEDDSEPPSDEQGDDDPPRGGSDGDAGSEAGGDDNDLDPWILDGDAVASVEDPAAVPVPPPPPPAAGHDHGGGRPAAPVARGPAEVGRARPGDNEIPWGPCSLSIIRRRGVAVGWGANCRRHKDSVELRADVTCKASITYGLELFSDDICQRKMKEWLLRGFQMDIERPHNPLARTSHIDVRVRRLAPRSNDELDAALRSLGFEP